MTGPPPENFHVTHMHVLTHTAPADPRHLHSFIGFTGWVKVVDCKASRCWCSNALAEWKLFPQAGSSKGSRLVKMCRGVPRMIIVLYSVLRFFNPYLHHHNTHLGALVLQEWLPELAAPMLQQEAQRCWSELAIPKWSRWHRSCQPHCRLLPQSSQPWLEQGELRSLCGAAEQVAPWQAHYAHGPL